MDSAVERPPVEVKGGGLVPSMRMWKGGLGGAGVGRGRGRWGGKGWATPLR